MAIELIHTTSGDKNISGVLHLPKDPSPPCVIASHGLFSSKDSEKFLEIAKYFSDRGIAVIRYDHQGCGESDGDISHTTVTSRIADLEAMFELAMNHPVLGGSMGLLGSSMGGFISIFKRAADPRVRALSLWATPAYIRGERESIRENIKETEASVELNDSFFRDITRYDVGQAIQHLDHCLILHGKEDELVPLDHAEKIYRLANPPKHLEIFEGGDHRFTNPEHRKKAIEMSFEWFRKYL